jgi:hypothetical protein
VRASRFLLLFAAAALAGMTVFAVLARRAVTVEKSSAGDAERQFAAVRERFGDLAPLLADDGTGHLARRDREPPVSPRPIARIRVMQFTAADGRLIRADVPFWFFELKAPAAQFFVRGTDLDLNELGLTASDLSREGPTLILDARQEDGDRLLVWTVGDQ